MSSLNQTASASPALVIAPRPASVSTPAQRVVSTSMRDAFVEMGYAGPTRILSARQCRRLLRANRGVWKYPPLDWPKGQAVTSRVYYEIAAHPAILERVVELLGPDVLLWGASMLFRHVGEMHPWHSDIESCHTSAKTVSVWLSIAHTSRESGLVVISRSHTLGLSIQEMRSRLGKARSQTSGEEVLNWAKQLNPRCELLAPEISPGEALFFDGRIWHGSQNQSARTRIALLLQYATPDTSIRISDLNDLDWPFRQLEQPRPACLMLNGSDNAQVNRIVPAPVSGGGETRLRLSSLIRPLNVPLAPDPQEGWKPYPLFRGATPDIADIEVHASVLKHGQCPHPPHRHIEEEILIVLAGEVDVILPDITDASGNDRRRLKAGQFVYYPSQFAHTIETTSPEPANYLMFKWQTDSAEPGKPIGFGQFNALDPAHGVGDGFQLRRLFEGPTRHLRRLECHASTMTPGAGYPPHADSYDVAILVLEGEVETLGQRVRRNGVIFYPAGEPHGLTNPGQSVARYLVFEFHGSRSELPNALEDPPSLLIKITDPQRWKRKLKQFYKQFRGEA